MLRRLFSIAAASIVCTSLYARSGAPPSPDETFHEAVKLLLRDDQAGAADLLQRAFRQEHTGKLPARYENARLLNLAAWVADERTRMLPGDTHPRSSVTDARDSAVRLAARAAYESPFDVGYWRDFVEMAVSRHPEFARDTLPQTFKVERPHAQPIRLLEKPGEQVTVLALLDERDGDGSAAEERLEKFLVDKDHRDACLPRIALAELQFSADRFTSAAATLRHIPKRCGAPPSVSRLRALIASASAAGTTKFTHAMNNWRVCDPYSWERLQMALLDDNGRDLPARKIDAQNHFDELAVAVLRQPKRPDTWESLWQVATMRHGLPAEYARVVSVVGHRRELRSDPAVAFGAIYPLLAAGKFEHVFPTLNDLIAAAPYDPRINTALQLVGAVLQQPLPKDLEERFVTVAPDYAAFIDIHVLRDCFADRHCGFGAIVVGKPKQPLLQAFKDGLSARGVTLDDVTHMQARDKTELATMIAQSEARSFAMISSLDTRQDRFELHTKGALAALHAEGKTQREAQRALQARMIVDEGRSHEVQRNLNALRDQYALTQQDLGRLATRIIADENLLQQMPNNFELVVQQEREAFQKMGERVDAVVKQIEPHLEDLGPDFKEAVDILRSPSKHSGAKIWKALAVVLSHWGASFSVGVGKNGMQAQLNLVTAADALIGWLVKKGYLTAEAKLPVVEPRLNPQVAQRIAVERS